MPITATQDIAATLQTGRVAVITGAASGIGLAAAPYPVIPFSFSATEAARSA